jgi:hypothetical protein
MCGCIYIYIYTHTHIHTHTHTQEGFFPFSTDVSGWSDHPDTSVEKGWSDHSDSSAYVSPEARFCLVASFLSGLTDVMLKMSGNTSHTVGISRTSFVSPNVNGLNKSRRTISVGGMRDLHDLLAYCRRGLTEPPRGE